MFFRILWVWAVFCGLGCVSPCTAAALILPPHALIAPNHPQKYLVKQGDTLWDIASLFLAQPWQVGDVWKHTTYPVYPGDEVSLVNQGNHKVLQIKHQRQVRLSPGVHIARDEKAIETIPVSKIRQFFNRPQIISAEQRDETPYIVEIDTGRLLVGNNDKIYVRGLDEDDTDNEYYIIVRQGNTYADPSNGHEVLAYEAIYLGEARLTQMGDPATLVIERAQREIQVGDFLLPVEEDILEQDFYPTVPLELNEAMIIAVVDGVNNIGQYQVVVINRGSLDDVERGNVLAVYQAEREIQDSLKKEAGKEPLYVPKQKSGVLLVFKVFDRVSYALVMRAERAIHVQDEVGLP